jgi:hypothetical protein
MNMLSMAGKSVQHLAPAFEEDPVKVCPSLSPRVDDPCKSIKNVMFHIRKNSV